MTAPDDEAWLTEMLQRRPPSTPAPDDFPGRVLTRLPRRPRPLRRWLGLAAVWGTTAAISLAGADLLGLGATGAPHPVVAFCLGTALLAYLADR